MISGNKYQRINDNDQNSSAIEIPVAIPEISGDYKLKLLHKEKSYEISNLTESSTIGELKKTVETITTVPPKRQRLVYSGKILKPDEKTLSYFKVEKNTSIHLFPLPEAPPPAATPTGSSNIVFNPLIPNNTVGNNRDVTPIHQPIHFDPFVSQTSREVKLWSIILMFLSGMTLFNNLSYITSTGKLGAGTLDSIVTVIDTLCSAGGLYVGNLGLNSVRTMDLSEIENYVKYLGFLAICSIVFRILWVLDIVMQVQLAVDKSKNSDNDNTDNTDKDSEDTDPDQNDENEKLDQKMVVTFAIQASLIALICISAWASCFIRAWRLRHAVQTYSNAMQV